MTATARDPNALQRAAADPSSSVWVNASAGSGKTKVLTDRVTRLLLSGVAPQKILCLTYTRAGAAEMANRVTSTLSKWATCDDAKLDADLDHLQNKAPSPQQRKEARRLFAKLLSCPGGLRIRTIHSFCQEILSRFPLEAGLLPHFALIDEQELEVLHNEVIDDLLREAAEQPEGALALALDILVSDQGETGFEKMLREAIRSRGRLAEAIEHAGNEQNLVTKMRDLLQLEPEDTPDNIRRDIMAKLPEEDMRKMAAALATGSEKYATRSTYLLRILETPAANRYVLFDSYRSVFLSDENEPRTGTGVSTKAMRALLPEIDMISTREAALLQLGLERIEAAEIAQTTASVLSLGGAFATRLAERKTARAALDYDDLILLTEKLLRKPGIAPWILYKLDNGIDHILVDEAQDTSRAQWNIVRSIAEEFYAGAGARENNRTLFVVGDEKQSIFSFQSADPEAFFSFREFFAQKLGAVGKKLEKIPLHTSFRSAPKILGAVDAIFANAATRAGVSPDPIEHLASKSRDGSEKIGRIEIWPLLRAAKDETKSDGEWIVPTGYEDERDPQAELAQQIARKIKFWLDHNETLPGSLRPIAPGDIMILLRRRGRFADLMVRALKTNSVPVTGVDRMKLVEQLPVMDLLAVMRFALLPEDDLNLATLLRGPLLGLSEQHLMELAIGRKGTLWQSLKDKAEQSSVFGPAYIYLSDRLNAADFSPPFAFLAQILNISCPANQVSGRKALWSRLGSEALDPIEELLNEAENFGRKHSPSLQNFLHWLTQSDADIKRELDRGGGQVRLMTVHASKGLEAPIIFLPDTTALPRTTDLPKFQWGESGTPLFLTRQPLFGMARELWRRARERQMEEYRRLFYVALTRAANCLYICGWQDGRSENSPEQSWYNLAASALRPLHHDFLIKDTDKPIPEIVLGDVEPSPASTLRPTFAAEQKISLPDWALRQIEKVPASIALAPSQIVDDFSAASPDAAFARGRIIHRLLQTIPDTSPDRRAAATARYLSQPRHNLNGEQREEIAHEVGRLLNDDTFAALFGPDSLAEVPLTGSMSGIPVFRQIDRLCLHGDEVWIVDYKTNRPPPRSAEDIPASYRAQLSEYRDLLRGIYRKNKCAVSYFGLLRRA